MDSKTGGFSFGFKAKKDSAPLKTKSVINETVEEKEETDFINAVDGSEIKSVIEKKKSSGPLVIPCITKNNWRIKIPQDFETDETDESKEKLVKQSQQQTLTSISDDLSKQAALALLRETEQLKHGEQEEDPSSSTYSIPLLLQNKVPDGYETDEKISTDIRPDESTLDDYESVPIEQFGLAILRGMGWKDGEGIGKNKKHVKPVEPHLRPKGMGLGADRSALLQAQGQKAKQYKPGDKRDEEPLQLRKGTHCVILKGPHVDLYGVIEALDEDNSRCVVKLSLSQQSITISQFSIKLVDKKEFDKYSRYINKGKTDRYKEKEAAKNNGHSNSTDNSPYSHQQKKSKQRSRSRDRRSRSRDRSPNTKPHKSSKTSHRSDQSEPKSSKQWACPMLKVKIIDRKFKDGKYYSTKVVVDDVLPGSIVCKTDSGRLLEGLHIEQLETVVPREDNSYIMIVKGEYKKQIGQLLQRNKEKEKVTVQLLSDRAVLLTLSYDDVCQYVGNIDSLLEY